MTTIFRPAFLICLFFLSLGTSFSQCKVRNIVNGCKPNLKPYSYDSYAISDLEFTNQPQKIEVQFTAFASQKYKLIFCTSGFVENLNVNIYDKSNRSKNRTKLFDSSSGIDNLFWSFEPQKTGDYYIEYELPPSSDSKPKKGCVVLIVGTRLMDYGTK